MQKNPYRYVTATEHAAIAKICQHIRVRSTGVLLHVDWYPQSERSAPIVVLNHGGGGHAGLFAKLALRFHAMGYSVAVPDQRGQGRSDGDRGDFTVTELVQNIVDVCLTIRQRTSGALFMIGSSIGGGLTYAAAAEMAVQGKSPRAVVCINLYDFGDARTGLEFSRFRWIAQLPLVPLLLRLANRAVSRLFPRVKIPYRAIANFSHMLDERDIKTGAYENWLTDPLALKSVTLRALVSLMDTPAAVPFSANVDVAVLVINPIQDRMVRPALTKQCFDQLTGPKAYFEIPFGHYSLLDEFGTTVSIQAHNWFQAHTEH